MTHTNVIDTHPDLQELRARYEEASLSPIAGVVNGLTMIAALYLMISPWVVGFNASTQLMINDLIVGGGLLVLAGSYALAFDRTHTVAWVAPLVGIWTIIAPWVIYQGAATPQLWISNVIVGGVVTLAGGALAGLGAMRAMKLHKGS